MSASKPRILLLAYHFPPVGGAGAQRAVKLVRRLAELGWDPVVVTRSGERGERYNPLDERLGTELPAAVPIHRASGGEPSTSAGWSSRVERLTGRIDRRGRWWARQAAATAMRVGRVELVHAFLEPYETALAADRVASRLGVPWIADLQDPWALDEVRVHISRLHLANDRRRMRRALRTAAAVVMNTDAAAAALSRQLPELARKPVYAIPNGFDAGEWERPAPQRSDGAFRIVHAGSLHTAVGIAHRRAERARRLLGGRVAPVTMLTRSHVFLLEALDGLLSSRPELSGHIELHLAGDLSDADLKATEGRSYVRPLGFLSHAETVELIRSADLLFLPMHELPPGTPARIVPCKTYEYLASDRPILAAVPDGDARTLLAGSPGVHLCRPSDVAAMRAAVAAEIDRPGPPQPVERRSSLRRYERDALADELVAVFEAALASSGRGLTIRDEGSPAVGSTTPIRS